MWQAWHLATSTFTLCGRPGTWLALVARLGPVVSGSAWPFVWQAWHLVTLTCTLSGRRGTWWHRPSLCVAGVALGEIDLHFVCQARHLWHWAGSGGTLGSRCRRGRRGCLCGRRGAWRHLVVASPELSSEPC